MAEKLKILKFPDPRLRTVAKKVEKFDKSLEKLTKDMLHTMYEDNGIGLAATQVNRHIRVIVMDLSEERNEPRVFINPEYKILSKESLASYEEGCLSVPNQFAEISRPDTCKVNFIDYNGNKKTLEAKGLLATCIQHEMDHLEGILFIDYLSSKIFQIILLLQ